MYFIFLSVFNSDMTPEEDILVPLNWITKVTYHLIDLADVGKTKKKVR